MRAVCQRVSEARVKVDGANVAEIGGGLVVLLGFLVALNAQIGDPERLPDRCLARLAPLRLLERDRRLRSAALV